MSEDIYVIEVTGPRAPAPFTVALRPGESRGVGGGWRISCRRPEVLCPHCRNPIAGYGCPAQDANGAPMHQLRSPWDG